MTYSAVMHSAIDRPPMLARAVLALVALCITSFVVWASFTEVDEIARGEGKVIPVSKTQIIQSSEPGVVRQIAVKLGQVVHKGQLLIQIENTTTESSLGEAVAKARALGAKVARLTLEERGDIESPFVCPPEILAVAKDVCANEESLLEADRAAYRNKVGVLTERVKQKENELNEARANIARLQENIAGVERQIELYAPLAKKKLVPESEVLKNERERDDLSGQLKVYEESLPRLQGQIDEAELLSQQALIETQQQALSDKAQVLAELSVVDETVRGASDRVKRTDIRSPVDGIVNTLDVTTIGAYVEPGTVLAGVVPTSDTLLVEARISPRDVAFVRRGQTAMVKVTAYDFSVFGGLQGEVENVSADSLVEKEKGETYYLVQVKTDQSALEKDGMQYSIIPGMVTSVEIMTGRKTVLSYLLKPINKARSEALTER
ncbi:HlyD family type I secretion periplasmic adaptor subunit [Pseudomonas sp. R2.Fl]|nr:HlyD family type I secretion periplasmic adaptor subunit [Pseudomonas sp. R2.Fl]